MVKFTSILLSLVLSCPVGVVLAAPVPNLDAKILQQNGECAQKLNNEFKNLTINDKCKSGDKACISGALAECDVNGAWEVSECSAGSQCFAVPNKKKEGANSKCLTEKDALSQIDASGAKGGIFAGDQTDTGNGTNTAPADSGSSNATAEASPSTDNSTATETVTVLIAPSTTQTIDAQTRTLSGADANSLLSSLQSDGVSGTSTSAGAEATGSSSTETSSDATASVTSSGAGGGVQGAAAAAATTILLTAASSSATAASTPAAANAASASAPPPSNGGYKY